MCFLNQLSARFIINTRVEILETIMAADNKSHKSLMFIERKNQSSDMHIFSKRERKHQFAMSTTIQFNTYVHRESLKSRLHTDQISLLTNNLYNYSYALKLLAKKIYTLKNMFKQSKFLNNSNAI